MSELTPRQRQHLKGLAHSLKPLLFVGKEGVTETGARAVADAFNTRELIKVKVQESAPDDARESGRQLAGRVAGAHLVQVIGRTVVLYRPHPTEPRIKLPPPKQAT
jgi:RNA-binding protein